MFDSILLALSLAVTTGEANAENRSKSDLADVSANKTAQVVAEVFEPRAAIGDRAGQSHHLSEPNGAAQVFQSEIRSPGSTPQSDHRSSDPRSIELREHEVLNASNLPGSGLATPGDGWDYNVNPFFRDGQSPALHQDSTPTLTFWQDTPQGDDPNYGDIRVEFAAANATPTNVLIPLPLAAWSALSIMGGAGLFRGCRKLRRRLK